MLKILQICNYFDPNRGGIEQVAQNIAECLESDAFAQKVICFNENAASADHVCRRRETVHDCVNAVPVIRCGCWTKLFSQSISPTFPRELRKLLRSFSPDVVIFHYPNPFEAFFLLRYLPPKTRLVLYWHLDIVKQRVLRHLFEGQNQRLLKRADIVVATSPNYIDGSPWLSSVREKCIVIPNSICEKRLEPTEASRAQGKKLREMNAGKIICAAVGRHVPYKGLKYLVRAAGLTDERFVFYLVGKGPETEQLKREAGGNPRIHFPGAVSDDELKALLQTADIFCFPSVTKNEAFGLSLAEAMYCGKPAVTFTIPGSGVNYVCPDGAAGIEVPNADVQALAEAIERLGADPELRRRLGEAGRRRVERLFSSAVFKDNIRQMLLNLMSKD